MPTARDINVEVPAINETYAAQAPGVGQATLNQINRLTLGNFDAQAFYNAYPGAQQQWNEWTGAGELQGWTPAQHAASFLGGMENDPRLNQFYTGGLNATQGQSAIDAQNIQNQLNTSAKTAAINDVNNLGGAATNAFFNANPTLGGAVNVLSSGVNGLNLGPQTIAGPTFNPIGTIGNPGQQGVGAGPMGPNVAGSFGPTPQVASFGGQQGGMRQGPMAAQGYTPPQAEQFNAPKDNFANPFLSMAKEYSNMALTPIQQMLQEQAMGDLKLGGSLSGEDIRLAQQASRAGSSARGLAMGKNAVGLEMLQTDAMSRARQNERRGFASAVDAQGFGQQTTNRQLGQGYASMANSAQQAGNALGLGYQQLGENSRQYNGNLGLNYAQLAQNDRQFSKNMGFNYSQLGQQAGMFNASNALQSGQFNAQLAQQQQAADRGFGLQSTALLGNIAGQAMAPFGAQGTGYGQANMNYQLAAGATPSYASYLGYGNDLFNTNYNAAAAGQIADKNNSAGIWGGVLGAVGKVGGAVLGGPVGAAIGAKLGSALGNKVGG